MRAANITERADLEGVRRSEQQIGALVEHEAARGIAPARIVLAGFSQGGAIALFAGLRYRQRLGGIVALSTYLIGPEILAAEASSANRDVPIFMAHGTRDPVVQLAWGQASRRTLEAGGWKVEWHEYAMEHSAVVEEIVAVGQFLVRVLGAGSPSAGESPPASSVALRRPMPRRCSPSRSRNSIWAFTLRSSRWASRSSSAQMAGSRRSRNALRSAIPELNRAGESRRCTPPPRRSWRPRRPASP